MELSKLKQLLGISEDSTDKDSVLQFVLDDVRETVLNYCGLEELPSGLTNTLYRMSVDLYRAENPGETETGVSIASISEGDTSTSFKSSSESIKGTLLKDYEKQLNRFRKFGW